MVIRSSISEGKLLLVAYAKGKGKQQPLATLEYDSSIEELDPDTLRADIVEMKHRAKERYAKLMGLQGYTSSRGGN